MQPQMKTRTLVGIAIGLAVVAAALLFISSWAKQQAEIPNDDIMFNGCAVAGCSGQLCVSADEAGDIVTTCEFRAEYACYKEAYCGPQADGKCGWSETPELKRCLANPPALDLNAEIVY